jgi:hypothetical protein
VSELERRVNRELLRRQVFLAQQYGNDLANPPARLILAGKEDFMRRRALVAGILFVVLAFVPRHVGAAQILGGQIIVQQDGDVIAEFLGALAGFTSGRPGESWHVYRRH